MEDKLMEAFAATLLDLRHSADATLARKDYACSPLTLGFVMGGPNVADQIKVTVTMPLSLAERLDPDQIRFLEPSVMDAEEASATAALELVGA